MGEKSRRLCALLEKREAEAALLGRRDSFAWFTGGASNHVMQASDLGAASLLVSRDRRWVICDSIEAPRIMGEELEGRDFELASFPWYAGSVAEAAGKLVAGKIISDTGVGGTENALEDLARLRWELTPAEIERYARVGEIVSAALAQAAHRVRRGMSEHEIAGLISLPLIEQGVQPTVLLVAVDGRIDRYRHPIPTTARLEKRAMLVACGRKWGLIVSATRMVNIGPVSGEIRRRHDAVVRVDEAYITNTVPGRSAAEVFAAGVRIYEETGFPDEWKLHHQGGPTGYVGRDFRASASTTQPVLEHQAFAWNPSITGTKSEDTMIATAQGPLMVSRPVNYPTLTLGGSGRELIKTDILVL